MFTNEQKEILQRSTITLSTLSEEEVFLISESSLNISELSDDQLIEFITISNALYRGGLEIISDADYDFIYLTELKNRQPDHPFLDSIESEKAFSGKTTKLPEPMLSTDKAYSKDQIDKWFKRIEKAANDIQINMSDLVFHVTPKLDGFAAYDDGSHLYTRGNGTRGTNITRVFDRGLSVADNGKRGQGAGEIVIKKSYFENHLADHFDNSRNVQASIIAEKSLNDEIKKAMDKGAAVFFPFKQLPSWQGTYSDLDNNFETITDDIWNKVDYDVDGVILEITNEQVKKNMGATRHHHRWQIAFKANVETAEVKVIDVKPQTSRSGRVNPVVNLEPTRLSGATISRVTAHHYSIVKNKGIGPGTIIKLVRSGLVIPKIEDVIAREKPQIPDTCPSCKATLIWDNDYLICPNNLACPAQQENIIEHFFKSLGNIDGFGSKTIEKLYANGIRSIPEIYSLNAMNFIEMGFGEKVSENLVAQLTRSRNESIEDWRFLSAFGVIRLGKGNSENLLQHHALANIFKLDIEDIALIDGFAETTAKAITEGLKSIKHDFFELYNLKFDLEVTPLIFERTENAETNNPIYGKTIVFTGTMTQGSRSDMEKHAKTLGAKVGKSVTGKTNLLITGEKVGENKISAATEKGVKVLTEEEYLILLDNN
jgi:DNA ligase (NAD+)